MNSWVGQIRPCDTRIKFQETFFRWAEEEWGESGAQKKLFFRTPPVARLTPHAHLVLGPSLTWKMQKIMPVLQAMIQFLWEDSIENQVNNTVNYCINNLYYQFDTHFTQNLTQFSILDSPENQTKPFLKIYRQFWHSHTYASLVNVTWIFKLKIADLPCDFISLFMIISIWYTVQLGVSSLYDQGDFPLSTLMLILYSFLAVLCPLIVHFRLTGLSTVHSSLQIKTLSTWPCQLFTDSSTLCPFKCNGTLHVALSTVH